MRNLVFLALITLAYVYIKKIFQSGLSLTEKNKAGQITDEMVRDPACGIYVPKNNAVRKTISRQEYFFCGTECAEKYIKDKPS